MSTPARKLRAVLVDDHPFVRDALAGLLAAQPEYEVVGQAGSVAEAVSLCARTQPALAIVDLRLPDGDGSTFLAHLQRAHPQTFAVVLSAFRTEEDLVAAKRAGARAYLEKTVTGAEFLETVRRVLAGEDLLLPLLNPAQRERLHQKDLTRMELAILSAVGRGLPNLAIAQELRISGNTVKSHLRHLFAKIGVSNRSQATAIAMRRGLADK